MEQMNSRINPESPAGAAFVHYVNSGELGPLGDSEREEFAGVAHMWLNTPVIADDAELVPLLTAWVVELEGCLYCGQPTDTGHDEHEECIERSMKQAVGFCRGDRIANVRTDRVGTVVSTYADGLTVGVRWDGGRTVSVMPSAALYAVA